MKLTPILIDPNLYPDALRPLLATGKPYDSSCSQQAQVLYIDADCGYFLKSAAKGTLEREAAMTRFFHSKGLSANVIAYISDTSDWLLTEKISGSDCTTAEYMEQPARLCDTIAELLAQLHGLNYKGCPVPNHTEQYLAKATLDHSKGIFEKDLFSDPWTFASPDAAWAIVEERSHLLRTDVLLHGDYCLPNIILNNWTLSGFIDLDSGGVGDRHVDIFWAVWTLLYNLKTNRYYDRFLDAYGREKVDEDILRVVAAVEMFR